VTPAGTWAVVWAEPAIDAAAGFLHDDPVGLAGLMDRIDALAGQPYATDSVPLGSFGLRRVVTGRYRVLYEVVSADERRPESPDGGVADGPDGLDDADSEGTVTVIHLGRLG
jgi:mRNA interferase RelE/StbE